MLLYCIDESGDHSLAKIDPQYPVFVLGGVIARPDYIKGELRQQVDRLKVRHFGDHRLNLHTADIVRHRAGFERLKDRHALAAFLADLGLLVRASEVTAVACAIRKDWHIRVYRAAALDPYLLALEVIAERFCLELENRGEVGCICAESRGEVLDSQLRLAWSILKARGSLHLSARRISRRISGIEFLTKKDLHPGLELADLFVSPVARHVIGRPAKPDWEIVKSKLLRGPEGAVDGYGLIVLPAKEEGQDPRCSSQP
jgi:hypothetical protein